MSLQSNADPRLLNGLLPVSFVLYFSFQFTILRLLMSVSEVEKANKEMRNEKATGDDDVPGDVLKLLGEGGLKILTKLINTIYKT